MTRHLTPPALPVEEYLADLLAAAVPDRVLRRCAAVVADTVAVARLASQATGLAGVLDGSAGGPASTVVEAYPGAAPDVAAFVNATAAVWNELDEGLRGAGHPGAHVVPSAVAVAETERVSVPELLTAVALGYQLQADLGRAVNLRPEIHPHGALGAPAAALAASRLLDLDARRAAHAVSIAANLAPAGAWSSCTSGRTVRNILAGQGAQAGVRAAYLARAGITASSDSLDIAYGVVRGGGGTVRLHRGHGWAITRGYLKHWSACAYTHSALDALADLQRQFSFAAADVIRVEVQVPEVGLLVRGVHTESPLAVRFSIPVLLATLIVHGDLNDAVSRAGADPAVIKLAERVTVEHDPAMTKSWPTHMPAAVRVTLRDGSTFAARVLDPIGPENDDRYLAAVRHKIETLGTGTDIATWMDAAAVGTPGLGVAGLFAGVEMDPALRERQPPAGPTPQAGATANNVTGGNAHGRSLT